MRSNKYYKISILSWLVVYILFYPNLDVGFDLEVYSLYAVFLLNLCLFIMLIFAIKSESFSVTRKWLLSLGFVIMNVFGYLGIALVDFVTSCGGSC